MLSSLFSRNVIIAATLLSISSCGKSKEEAKPITLVGRWESKTLVYTSYNAQNQVTFQSTTAEAPHQYTTYNTDGTYQVVDNYGGRVTGTYTLADKDLTSTYSASGGVLVTLRYTILELTQDKLRLRLERPLSSGSGREVSENELQRQ